MSKRLKPEAHLRAGRILKSFGLSFDFGFMLVDPYSTFRSIRQNVDFLEEFIGDGWTVAPFCRMLPYAGTPIKRRLESEGRLLGTSFDPDYKFLDPKLDLFYDWMVNTFYERNFTNQGLCHILRGLLFEASLRLRVATPGLGCARRLTCNTLLRSATALRATRFVVRLIISRQLRSRFWNRIRLPGWPN